MGSFVLHDIELRNIDISTPSVRSLSVLSESYQTFESVDTKFGPILIHRQGCEFKKNRPILITYHDIGLNSASNFQAFFNHSDMKLLLDNITVLHINAPGQEENAINFCSFQTYPTLDELSDQIIDIIQYYKIKNFIGFGVGAGANIISRFALKYPNNIDGIVLINPTSTVASWTEWFYQKINIHYLSSNISGFSNTIPQNTRDYLMWYHFGKEVETRNHDLCEIYKNYFLGKTLNAKNLSMFINSYIKRTDFCIERSNLQKNFKCPILLICGALSPHLEDSIYMNSRLDPANSTWLKLQDCGMVLEEQPGKVIEALKLFIQGMHYALTSYDRRKSSLLNNENLNKDAQFLNQEKLFNDLVSEINEGGDRKNEAEKIDFSNPDEIHIVENPIPTS